MREAKPIYSRGRHVLICFHFLCIIAININKFLGDFHLLIFPKPGPYQDELPAKALDNRLAYQAGGLDQFINTFGGDQVILVESPPGWNKLEIRNQSIILLLADALSFQMAAFF
jgi:hypothetical protein